VLNCTPQDTAGDKLEAHHLTLEGIPPAAVGRHVGRTGSWAARSSKNPGIRGSLMKRRL
jgi:hypothetical protein